MIFNFELLVAFFFLDTNPVSGQQADNGYRTLLVTLYLNVFRFRLLKREVVYRGSLMCLEIVFSLSRLDLRDVWRS